MTGNIVARRYASALFALGKKSGLAELEKYSSALTGMRSVLEASPDLVRVFRTPIVTGEEKSKLVKTVAEKLGFGGTILNFLLLLAEKNRLDQIEAIACVYDDLLDAEKGILRGKLFTAVEMQAEEQTKLVSALEQQAKRTLALEFGVSPEIIGGVVLKVGDLVMDASLRAQLSILKDTIKRGE